jgi:hypothetical protein
MTELTNEQIWELRFNASIERFGSFDEEMEIPGYSCKPELEKSDELDEFEEKKLTELQQFQQSLKLRFEACKQRYRGMEEYMDIPDMDLWLNLKNEIIPKRPKLERQVCQSYYKVGEEFYTVEDEELDEMELNKLVLFDVNDCADATTVIDADNNDYDDYYYDSDNYSRDSEYRLEREIDKFLCSKSGSRWADKFEDRYG